VVESQAGGFHCSSLPLLFPQGHVLLCSDDGRDGVKVGQVRMHLYTFQQLGSKWINTRRNLILSIENLVDSCFIWHNPKGIPKGGLGEGGVGKSLGELLLILVHACLFLLWLSPGLLAVALIIGVEDFSYHAIGTLLKDRVDSSVLLPGLLNLDQLLLLGFELGALFLGLGSSCRIQMLTFHAGARGTTFCIPSWQLPTFAQLPVKAVGRYSLLALVRLS
jgi:hypothetical protein